MRQKVDGKWSLLVTSCDFITQRCLGHQPYNVSRSTPKIVHDVARNPVESIPSNSTLRNVIVKHLRFRLISSSLILLATAIAWVVTTAGFKADEERKIKQSWGVAGRVAFQEGYLLTDVPSTVYHHEWTTGWEQAKSDATKREFERQQEEQRKAEEHANLESQKLMWIKCEEHLDQTYRKTSRSKYQLKEMQGAINAIGVGDQSERDFARKFLTSLSAQIDAEEKEFLRDILEGKDWSGLQTLASNNGWRKNSNR